MTIRIAVLAAALALAAGCRKPPTADSSVAGNVPQGKAFAEFMQRDLRQFFCPGKGKECSVQYELLRQQPTQTGLAYPKFYLWVRSYDGARVTREGAARLAAIGGKRFEVTDFLSNADILKTPEVVPRIFPAELVDKITQKARGQ